MSKTERKPLRWRRGKTEGRMIVIPTWELRRDGEVLARAQQDRKTELWFWYGMNRNTAGNMRPLEEVKAEAEQCARAALSASSGSGK